MMIGKYYLNIQDKFVRYELSFDRRITVITGRGGTGKSTLINMLQFYLSDGNTGGVVVDTNIPNIVVFSRDTKWKYELLDLEGTNTVIFADEDCKALRSLDFVKALFRSGCYLVCACRDAELGASFYVQSICVFESVRQDNRIVTHMRYIK